MSVFVFPVEPIMNLLCSVSLFHVVAAQDKCEQMF